MNAELRPAIDLERIVTSVEESLPDTISAEDLHSLVARKAADLSFIHPLYDKLAGRIEMDIIRSSTPCSFSGSCYILGSGPSPILSPEFMADLFPIKQYLDLLIENSCSYPYTYSALKAMEHTYLLKKNGKVIERPSYMFMRIAVHLHRADVKSITTTYELLSHHAYTHATPTMANAGTVSGQLSSCYLISPGKEYSTASLYDTLCQAAEISSSFGGIGIDLNSCPGTGSQFGESLSQGLRPVLQLFEASLSVNVKGQSRRPAAMTAFIEPWHLDVLAFINMRRGRLNDGVHHRALFGALWVPDLFMERVHANAQWTLFSPHHVPLLSGCFGPTFNSRYVAYEQDLALPRVTVRARSVMHAIAQSQIETGGPFIMFKDTINYKSNQSNMGVITHSNLCTEVVQYSSAGETAVCNLASVVLPYYVRDGEFDFEDLHKVVQIITLNLNRVIDRTICPSEQSARGNFKQRAIGIGIQGLADTLIALGIPYESDRAASLNKDIMETMYHAALSASVAFARQNGCYPLYAGSPLSQGVFQFDFWDRAPSNTRYDWAALRDKVYRHGVANSLLIALMPTSGTTQITSCTESFEPIQSCIFTRHVLSGEYKSLSPMLVQILERENLWSDAMRLQIVIDGGSIQGIEEIPDNIKELFLTAWEIGPKPIIDLAIHRAPYTCQSQSLSLYMENPSPADVAGLKTGLYYLRTKPATRPIPVTVPLLSPPTPNHHETPVSDSSSGTSSSPLPPSPSSFHVNVDVLSQTDNTSSPNTPWVSIPASDPPQQANGNDDLELSAFLSDIIQPPGDYPPYVCNNSPFPMEGGTTVDDLVYDDPTTSDLPLCEVCGA